jgi:hypothetical protein
MIAALGLGRWRAYKSFMKYIFFLMFVGTIVVAPAAAQLPPPRENTPSKTAPAPRLFVEKRSHDLGKILEGDVVTVSWKIENRGTADLIIDRTGSACGCTVVKLRDEDKVIKPGGSLDLKVEFNSSSRHGDQNKEITVFSNDPLEPTLKLTFQSHVEALFTSDPTTVVNLRVIRRGEAALKPLEILPVAERGDLTVTQIDVEGGSTFEVKSEPFEKNGLKGAKVFFTISESAALGPVNGSVTVNLRVGELERSRVFSVRGEVVGDLTWLPKVLDATRQASLPGTTLAPITISSTDERPFKILEAGGGSMLTVTVGPGRSPKAGTEYAVQVGVSDSAPPGPFGTLLRIQTDSLDQPVVEVPVFGIVASKLEVEPATVLVRNDGTEAGTRRRVRIKTADASPLNVQGVKCDTPALSVAVDSRAGSKYSHLVYIETRLTGTLPPGTHRSVVHVATDVAGAEKIEIPVRIEIR